MEFEEIGAGPRGLVEQNQKAAHPSDLWLSPDAVIAAMAKEGDPVPTGWAPLDARLRRGGIPPGRVISIGGPPFAGKTTVVAQIAVAMAERIPVFALFSDEGRAQAAMRIGVMLGVPLESIEEKPDEAAAQILERMGERSIYLLKPETEVANAEEVFAYAASHRQEGQPALVILDSIQTIPPQADPTGESERVIYKQFMALCRAKASEHGFIVLLTSQSNRASYRSKKTEENSVSIASFSGTAAIEFLSDVALVLSLPDEASDIVKVDTVKNRLVNSAQRLPRSFHVRYDSQVGQMLEVDPEALQTANVAAIDERLRPAKAKVSHELKTSADGLTSGQVSELSKVRKATVIEVLDQLEFEKRVFHKKEGRQILYFWIVQ